MLHCKMWAFEMYIYVGLWAEQKVDDTPEVRFNISCFRAFSRQHEASWMCEVLSGTLVLDRGQRLQFPGLLPSFLPSSRVSFSFGFAALLLILRSSFFLFSPLSFPRFSSFLIFSSISIPSVDLFFPFLGLTPAHSSCSCTSCNRWSGTSNGITPPSLIFFLQATYLMHLTMRPSFGFSLLSLCVFRLKSRSSFAHAILLYWTSLGQRIG